MSTNKGTKHLLEKNYGKGCMFEKAQIEEKVDKYNQHKKRKIKTYKKYKEERRLTLKEIKNIEGIMSVHHLKHRSEGGKSDLKNCANINRLAHDYLHSLPRNQEEIINDMIREYKKEFKLISAEIEGNKIVKAQVIKLEEPKEDYISIPAYDNKKEQELYEEHKRKRNERVFKKFEELER